jgi:muconolactone delta-isomerase
VLFHVDARIPDGADIAPLLEAEIAAVAELRRIGFVTHLWRRPDGTGAYLVVEADGEESAQATLDALPFPTNGLMVMHVTPIEAL